MRRVVALGTFVCLAACTPPVPAPEGSARNVEAHVRFLADDLLEGREAGTRGYDLAALYVASQFAQIGLQPAGGRGDWRQPVPLIQGERQAEGAAFVLRRGEVEHHFVFEQDYLPAVVYDHEQWEVEAALVFVGQAVVAPEYDHDDLAGVDLQGKIAVVLSGAPARFGNDQRAYYASGREKQRLLVERGAIGLVWIGDPERESRSPWARAAANWARPGMRLRDASGHPVDTFPQLRGGASLSADAARHLFDGAEQSADEVFEHLEKGSLRAFDLPVSAHLRGSSRLTMLDSHNVVGLLPGSDPGLAAEHIVYTAHLDHVGLGAEVEGDGIYNGALDNALGIGVLIEAARLAKALPRPQRSQVFLAVTAEEKGLLGAEHFAENPSVDGRIVANINMDMPVILAPQRDVIPIGVQHSTLAAHVEAAAADLGVLLTPDPFPEEVVFVRSDQFAFVRRGIPAVYLKGGIQVDEAGLDGREMLDGFLRRHYHQPSDDLNLSIHWPTAARLATLNAAIGQRVGRAAEAPRWNPGNFFGQKFAGE